MRSLISSLALKFSFSSKNSSLLKCGSLSKKQKYSARLFAVRPGANSSECAAKYSSSAFGEPSTPLFKKIFGLSLSAPLKPLKSISR